MNWFWRLVALLLVLIAWYVYASDWTDDTQWKATFDSRRQAVGGPSRSIRVVTFNVRLDAEEADPENHFTKRVFRLRDTMRNWGPDLIGLQEPFGGQLHHLLSTFDNNALVYTALGYNRPGIAHHDLVHPARHDDFNVGILYRNDTLELLEQDYQWLSTTPHVPGSKDWGSMGVRAVNIAKFKHRATGVVVLHFNTHLDVRSELARRHQSALLLHIVQTWTLRHRGAAVFVTGDFNSAPGQSSHRTLLSASHLLDAWESCLSSSDSDCVVRKGMAVTFHGWLGDLPNSFIFRPLLAIAFTAHALGLNVPLHVPTTLRGLLRALYELLTVPPAFGIFESVPKHAMDLKRFHVDWILHGGDNVAKPITIAVVDVRRESYSSDHFPVIGDFGIKG